MTKQQLDKLECKKCLIEAITQRAIDNGVKLLQKERQRDWRERPLEVKFFGKPL